MIQELSGLLWIVIAGIFTWRHAPTYAKMFEPEPQPELWKKVPHHDELFWCEHCDPTGKTKKKLNEQAKQIADSAMQQANQGWQSYKFHQGNFGQQQAINLELITKAGVNRQHFTYGNLAGVGERGLSGNAFDGIVDLGKYNSGGDWDPS